jgi:hypothetical protein
MATSARIAVVGDVVSLSLSLICFYLDLEILTPCEMTIFFFFFFCNDNVWFLKHDDWNLQEDTKALQFLQVFLSLSLSKKYLFIKTHLKIVVRQEQNCENNIC